MEPAPEQQVLVYIPEILDVIFKFLNPQDLVKCRKVCSDWRAISNIHLKRRLVAHDLEQTDARFGTMQDFRGCRKFQRVRLIGYNELVKFEIPSLLPSMAHENTKKPVVSSCLVIQDSSTAVVAANKRGAHKIIWRKVKPMPWFVSTVLQVDWLPTVEKLVLDRCLTVDDWNAAANAILVKFPSLTELELWLPQDRSNVLPLVYSELLEEEPQQVELPSIKKIVLQYYMWFNSTSKSCYKRKRNLTRFKLESIEWFSGVDWDFLKKCPNLQNFYADVYFGHPELFLGQCDFAQIRASRSVPENTVQEYCPWELAAWTQSSHSVEKFYNFSVLAQDIANLISTLEPAKLQIPLQLKLHFALASSSLANTVQLEFCEANSQIRWSDPVEASTHDVASVFKLAASFENIQRLDFLYFCSRHPLNFEDTQPLPPTRFAKNLVTLAITSSNGWMQENLNRLMPNVQLLIFSYKPRDVHFYELPKVLKLCSSLSSLRHLVLVIMPPNYIETKDICAELANLNQDLKCFNGLVSSLTVVSCLPVDLKLLTEQFLSICTSAKSIRKLGVFVDVSVDTNTAEELDVSKWGLPIPDHLTVLAGPTTLLGSGEAEFDGMEHSYVDWEELLRRSV